MKEIILFKSKKSKLQTKNQVKGFSVTNIFSNIFNRGSLWLTIFCLIILILTLKGLPGNPTPSDLNTKVWRDEGPFELSPERGRYALLYSFAENNSVTFLPEIAKFVVPDVGYFNGNYVTLFAPTLSFAALPGYYIGKYFGYAQIGSFIIISIFALLNFILIRAIAVKLGANKIAGSIGGLIFLFGTPAFAYALTLYQHHLSTLLILTCVYLLIKYNSFYSLTAIWLLAATAVTVDFPNFFLMIPIAFYALYRFFEIKILKPGIRISLSLLRLFTFVGAVLPMALFFWFNYLSYGSPFQIGGTVPRAVQIDPNGQPVLEKPKEEYKDKISKNSGESQSMFAFFKNRNITEGMYTFFASPDRSIIVYTPVVIFGIIAGTVLLRKKQGIIILLSTIFCFNVVLYSMWGDPYGGWAFGARYLIPGYAMLAILTAILLSMWGRKSLFLLIFFIILNYSFAVNTIGALTSNKNPPLKEIAALEKQTNSYEPYTYERNIKLLNLNISSSFIYNTVAVNRISAWGYFAVIMLFLLYVSGFLHILLWRSIGK